MKRCVPVIIKLYRKEELFMKSKCYILIFLITLLAAALSVSAQSFDSESLNMASDPCRIDDNGNDGNFRDEVTASQAITTPINWDDKMIIPDTAQARAFEDHTYCYFIMEYIEGGNIYSYIPKNGVRMITHSRLLQ